MDVIIGIDPHKAHTAVAVGHGEVELARLQVRSGGNQVGRLLAWAEPFASRRQAMEPRVSASCSRSSSSRPTRTC